MKSVTKSVVFVILAILIAATVVAQTSVFVTAKSAHYHTHRDCIALMRAKPEHVLTIDLKDIGSRTLCGICAHRKH